MKTKIICILDRSGSMESIIDDSITGFNNFLKEQQEIVGDATMSILLFDTEFQEIVSNKDIKYIEPLTQKIYYPGGGTSLYDSIGISIDNELDFLAKDPKNRSDKTLIVILTDGEENSSNLYHKEKIKYMITEMKEIFKWEFLFLAANQDAILTADGIGISSGNSINWTANSDGINVAYENMSNATKFYRTTENVNYNNIFQDSVKK